MYQVPKFFVVLISFDIVTVFIIIHNFLNFKLCLEENGRDAFPLWFKNLSYIFKGIKIL